MNRVERAIIMAAGKGTRMRPLTLEIPKPLIQVNGARMIDTVINALHANGIREIYVVTGYLGDRFRCLEKKYGVRLIDNPYYESCNNISSLYAAREYIGGAMILDGDQIIYDTSALSAEFERSCYNAVRIDEHTDEWLLTVGENDIITHCSRTGGSGGWQLFSVSRWTRDDGERLRRHLEIEFDVLKNRDIYWDDVAMFRYPEEYELGIFKMERGAVMEIDSLAELAAIDKSYAKYL